jgi:BlaI family transcriptional regulator, penicillinase repressor
MARPRVKELTQRELEIMHVFWRHGEQSAAGVREQLAAAGGPDLAYTTVATLVRILLDKGYLRQTNDQRPFVYRPLRSFRDVSKRILGDVVNRVFHGSRKELLLQLMEDEELTDAEREILERLVQEP